MKRRVGIDDANESDVWKIQAFGNHLRAQQYFDFTTAKAIQRRFVALGPAHRIAVHTQARHIGKAIAHLGF